VADAYAHAKFIGYTPSTAPLLSKAGLEHKTLDDGFVALTSPTTAKKFVAPCRALRFWRREPSVHPV